MILLKLILNIIVLIFPFIFKRKDDFYDAKIKTISDILKIKKENFERLNADEKSIILSNLHNDIHRIFELRA